MLVPILILIATVAYAFGTLMIARASLHIDSNLAGTIVNSLAALIPFLVFLVMKVPSTAGTDKAKGVLLAVLGGLGIAVFTIALTKVFSLGGNVSYVTPMVYGGAILISSLVGWLVFKETLSGLQAVGLGLVVIGILLIVISRLRLA